VDILSNTKETISELCFKIVHNLEAVFDKTVLHIKQHPTLQTACIAFLRAVYGFLFQSHVINCVVDEELFHLGYTAM
jgi:hypothetical protein